MKDNYITPELLHLNEIQPKGWDTNGNWIGIPEWIKRYGNREYITINKKRKTRR